LILLFLMKAPCAFETRSSILAIILQIRGQKGRKRSVEHIPFGERAAESKRNGQILMGHRNSEGCHFAAVAGPHTHSQPSPTRRRKRPGRRHPRASAARPDAQAPQSNDLPNLPGKIRSGQRPPPEPDVPVVAIARVNDSSPFLSSRPDLPLHFPPFAFTSTGQ
jgi:hypothetical protein